MRQINEKVTRTGQESETAPRWWKRYWLIYGSFMFLWLLVVAPLLRHSVPPVASPIQNYESETRIAGLPLWARGSTPRGIIAIGGQPIGLVAIGGLPVGIIAVGGAGAGIFCFSGLAVGLFALGGGAVGWWSLGGGAVGYYAFGGLSVGGYAYAGNGVALGYYEASGRQKEKLWG